MYRSKTSDRYFELKERVMELAKNSRTIATAFRACNFCHGSGSVHAVKHMVEDGEAIRRRFEPTQLLPCVCTVGWPFFGQGGRGTD